MLDKFVSSDIYPIPESATATTRYLALLAYLIRLGTDRITRYTSSHKMVSGMTSVFAKDAAPRAFSFPCLYPAFER